MAALGSMPAIRSEAAGQGSQGRELYELRRYRLKDESKSSAFMDYLSKNLIPVFSRAAIKPIGAFREIDAKGGPAYWLLLPLASATSLSILADRQHDLYKTDEASAWLKAEKKEPAFERIDSWLHLAFEGMPQLAVPDLARGKQKRIFELRTYESHSEPKGLKKVEMFNSGEIQVMKEVNLRPVFYGQALLGGDLPHLTYMLCGENREEHKKHFDAFLKHPIWLKLKDDPAYADTVSKITSRFLEPLEGSDI